MSRRVPRGRTSTVFTTPSHRPRPAVLAALVVTVVAVPFLVADALGGDDSEVAVAGRTERRGSSVPGSAPVTGAPTTTVPSTSIPIDPRWLPKGVSRYGESDEDTMARITRRRGLVAAALPTTTTTSTSVPGSSTTSRPASAPAVRPTSTVPSPATTAPPPTAPPVTPPSAPDPPPTDSAATVPGGPGG